MGEQVALNLYGVTVSEAHEPRIDVPGTLLITLRDLAAICGEGEYTTLEPTPDRVAHYTDIVTTYSQRGPVLPAPLGVTFKHKDAVDRWLELHYVALSNALTFVDNRVVARVHVWSAGAPDERDTGSDFAAVAAESLRTLRRAAVTTVPLRLDKATGLVLSAAYLVERDLWKDFSTEVDDQGRRAPSLKFELTGPWPPYDFVQMQLGT